MKVFFDIEAKTNFLEVIFYDCLALNERKELARAKFYPILHSACVLDDLEWVAEGNVEAGAIEAVKNCLYTTPPVSIWEVVEDAKKRYVKVAKEVL